MDMFPDDPEIRLSRKESEEQLREYAALGNWKAVDVLLQAGINPNATNAMNNWTALHWASHRNQARVVIVLLRACANPLLTTNKGQTAADLTTDPQIIQLLQASSAPLGDNRPNTSRVPQGSDNPPLSHHLTGPEPSLPFQPSYLRNPDLAKQWGLPEGVRLLTGSHPHTPEPATAASTSYSSVGATDRQADVPSSKRIRPSPDPPGAMEGPSNDAVASVAETERLELVVYREGLQSDNVKGAVFVSPTMTLQSLTQVIREELDDIPAEFKLYRQRDNLEIPIGTRQYTAPIGQHFGSSQGVVIIKAKPA